MKNGFLLCVFCAASCFAQSDGSLISRSVVSFPAYELEPSIEMYYDREAYNSAIQDREVTIEKIVYYSDGLKVVGYLSSPVDFQNKAWPVIIFNRGSGIRNDISYVHAPLFKKLVHEGFVVFAPALRGSEGGEGTDEIGGRDVEDIMNTLPLFDHLPHLDKNNIFMLGESRGGIMTYLSMKRNYPLRAAAVIGAITDFALYFESQPWAENFFKESFPGYEEQRDSILSSRSAINWAGELNAPLLIMNGQADPQVVPAHALQLAGKLSQLGKKYQLIILEGGNHILSKGHINRRDREVIEWFNKYIR